MDLILLDWTRMGRTYCLAGVVAEGRTYRMIRPLLAKHRAAAVRNVGWSPYLLDGHCRWEVFEVVGPLPTPESRARNAGRSWLECPMLNRSFLICSATPGGR